MDIKEEIKEVERNQELKNHGWTIRNKKKFSTTCPVPIKEQIRVGIAVINGEQYLYFKDSFFSDVKVMYKIDDLRYLDYAEDILDFRQKYFPENKTKIALLAKTKAVKDLKVKERKMTLKWIAGVICFVTFLIVISTI